MNKIPEWYGMDPQRPFPLYSKEYLAAHHGNLREWEWKKLGTRNRWICHERASGKTWEDLSEMFGLKTNSIKVIVRGQAPWLMKENEKERNARELNNILKDYEEEEDLEWLN